MTPDQEADDRAFHGDETVLARWIAEVDRLRGDLRKALHIAGEFADLAGMEPYTLDYTEIDALKAALAAIPVPPETP